tara:strand:- start:5065 stop:5313 length:249 start_codon:yes stop_codon:yes gene_type:complete
MPIYFDELETILNQWKMYSLTNPGDKVTEIELKQRMLAKIETLFERLHHDQIRVTEEANLDNTNNKIKYDNIVRINVPCSKL